MDGTRGRLLPVLRLASQDKTAKAARKAHKELRLPEPTVEEIAGYRRSVSPDLEMLAAQRYVDSLLDIRTKPLMPGQLRKGRRRFQQQVLNAIELSVHTDDKKVKKEFEKLAMSFSRLFALYYYDEKDRQPSRLEGRLQKLLPYLAKHLLAETELCIEARFSSPFKNLSKISVFDIQQKLEMLEGHDEAVVKENARTIVCAALVRGNLELADKLASGAKEKLRMLEGHDEAVVKENARTIVCAALNRGNLELADKLASGAKEKLRILEKHSNRRVVELGRSIMSRLFTKGNLEAEQIDVNGIVIDL